MVEASRNTAVLLAGGVGARVGLALPKQLVKIAGRPIMEHTLAALNAHPDIDDIIVMMTPGYLDVVHQMVTSGGFSKVRHVLEGGESRSHTALRALDAVSAAGDPKVMTHDAVRPFVSARIISDCFAALDSYDAVDVTIESRDTFVEVSADNTISRSLPRSARRGQTPQAFRISVLRKAYERAMADPAFEPADDCTVVHRYAPEVPIYGVAGDVRNIKITEPIDIFIADKLFQLSNPDSVSLAAGAEDDHAFLTGKSLVVFGGGSSTGRDIADLARKLGANVKSFSRAEGTRVERREDIESAAAAAVEEVGKVDYVVNATGVMPRGRLMEAREEEIYGATEINYLAPVHIAQTFFPLLKETSGSLLLFASPAYVRGRSGNGLHSSANAAVVNLTQALADEWAPSGVRINCVIPPEHAEAAQRATDFDEDRAQALIDAASVARACVHTLLSKNSGRIVDLHMANRLALRS